MLHARGTVCYNLLWIIASFASKSYTRMEEGKLSLKILIPHFLPVLNEGSWSSQNRSGPPKSTWNLTQTDTLDTTLLQTSLNERCALLFLSEELKFWRSEVLSVFFFFLGKAKMSKVTWYERMSILAVIVFIIYHISNISLMSVSSSVGFSVHKI